MGGVAEGLRVVDLSWGTAGPMTTMLLADHGADVVRVERPNGARFGEVEGERVWHRGQRSAVLDLAAPGDLDVLLALAARADILVESFRPGVTDRLGIAYERLGRLNPRLIYCSITGYGRGTRLAARPGYDALVAARCGLQWEARGWYGSPMHRVLGLDAASADVQPSPAIAIGSDRDGPIFPATAAPSVGAAYLATLGISAALVARERTGRGQLVETSLMQGVLMTNAAGWQRPQHVDAPGYYASVQDRRQTWSLLQAADGWVCMWASPLDWVTLAGSGDRLVAPDRQRLAEIRSSRGAAVSIEDRLARLEEAAPIVRRFPVNSWVELAAELGDVSCQPVRSPEQALCDPSLLAEGSVVEMLDPDLGLVRQAGGLFRLHDRPVTINRPAPHRGQHTDEIRREAAAPPVAEPLQGDTAPLRKGPLDGVRIVDFGLAVAGPWASQVLADLGADVIKVDPPRQAGWLSTNMAISVNRSKRSVCIDMKSPGGGEVAYDLVRWADVVIFNMRPQAAAKLGLDYESVARVNPSVVYCHTRGFDDGPRSLLPGNDQTANALAGTLWEDGGCSKGGRPWFGSTSNGDLGNGFLAAIAIVQALFDRHRTGRGQRVDSSIVNAGLFNNSRVMTTPEGSTFERSHLDASQTGLSALYRIYRCADEWLCLAITGDDDWHRLATALPALRDDRRFATAADRQKHDDDLAAVLSSAFASREAAEWFAVLDTAGVPCEISDPTFSQRLFDDAELLERQWVVRLEGEHPVGRIDMIGIGIDFSDTPSRVVGAPPPMWSDTRAVLEDLGYDEPRIARLFESGAGAHRGVTKPFGRGWLGQQRSVMNDDYDEFALLHNNAADAGLPSASDPAVVRRFVEVGDGRRISALVWGSGAPDAIFLHGGAQNAHTWDTVALALSRPLVAIDLPGHGHSDWRPDGNYRVAAMADDVAATIEALAPGATSLVGIGLGSPVALLTADRRPGIVTRLVMIDSASGARIPGAEARHSVAAATVGEFTGGPHEFGSFDDILERTLRYNPGRSKRSLQRGILHNAERRPDGTWAWRWDPNQKAARDFAFDDLETALERFTGPVLLVRGGLSDIVTDEAVAAFFRRHPDSRLVTIEGAGHGVQGDRPVELARQLDAFLTQ